MDTTIYLDYLARALWQGCGEIHTNVRFEKLEDFDTKFDFVINCAGFARASLSRMRISSRIASGRDRAELEGFPARLW